MSESDELYWQALTGLLDDNPELSLEDAEEILEDQRNDLLND
jgi:hypothetical protein